MESEQKNTLILKLRPERSFLAVKHQIYKICMLCIMQFMADGLCEWRDQYTY